MLTEREQRVLDFMKKEIRENGFPPTVREICAALNIRSTSTAHKDIDSLVKKGYVKKNPAKPRAFIVLDDDFDQQKAVADASSMEMPPERTDVIDVPVVGRIAAGVPILAEQNVEDSFPIPARYVGRGSTFMLTVRGESMIEAGIMDGDYILVEESNTARDGEIVVAMIDGFESEATVKTFYKERDHIRLQPENSNMSSIIVKDVKILGKVIGVFRFI